MPEKEELEAPKTSKKEQPASIVKRISEAKGFACAEELTGTSAYILSADTLVFLNGKVLGKPKDEKDARKLLGNLSGRWHTVYTGVSLIERNAEKILRKKSIHVATKVKFFRLRKDWIEWYVNTGEPMDKAGAYGAQGYGAMLVEKFSGSYTNVVGLPVGETLELLEKISGSKREEWR